MLPVHADVVVVGGGSCGSVDAARHSDDPDRTVLLLESGPGYRSIPATPSALRDAAVLPVGPGSDWVQQYPASLTAGVATTIARGRVLGGSGAVNGAYFVRARPDDFARWPSSWSFERVLPHFRAVETDLDFADEWHGRAGPIPVSRTPWDSLHPVARAFHEAAVAAGHAVVDDLNAPGSDGVGRVPMNVRDGVRYGPALACLLPVLHRPNLTVRTGVRVRAVALSSGRAVGVEVHDGTDIRTITAGRVVLCAGAVCSPQLLMLSGIGPADELRRSGIAVEHEAPGVGRGFTDHPEVAIRYRYRRDVPRRAPLLQTVLHTGEIEYRPYTVPFGAAIPGSGVADPVLGVVAIRPHSRGDIRLDPTDPAAPPILDYRYLIDIGDCDVLRRGVRDAAGLLTGMSHVVDRHSLDPETRDPSDAWLARHLGTSLHLSGTCRMGPGDDAVVDELCRVRGVEGLSVVDTSVFPEVPSRGPHATAVMLAHRIAGGAPAA
ncbi:mycofactocin dehydrogenase MftG [Rhodococcus chondri]|uniref:Mycofactocin system GMC family oxidoreductase MftG n=1 Tax=Rhodococcus chondri TaxID=3065941 RepID=A0ABU7JPI8_9NOCA|nr:mycofactocin system GMC family oxidoreductase MftG [Rhodococcus sp. CC-R104]MEE2031809.1 mycofactocin system GMC family oxidoreductase MftG [Rhodococcus sp. CC-R104]